MACAICRRIFIITPIVTTRSLSNMHRIRIPLCIPRGLVQRTAFLSNVSISSVEGVHTLRTRARSCALEEIEWGWGREERRASRIGVLGSGGSKLELHSDSEAHY